LTGTPHIQEFRDALCSRAERYEIELTASDISRLSNYYALMLIWNPRLHLVAPCSPTEFATRHVLESLLLLPHLSTGAHVADIGSGAGLPIIPNLILRPDLRAILIEASKKKAVFLREALSVSGASEQTQVVARRFETMPSPEVNVITCRALDHFAELLPTLVAWAPRPSTLLLFGGVDLQRQIEEANLKMTAVKIPNSERRYLFSVAKE
jgi:16S rRNA (guanine527-N7)-methyltransferase